MCDGLLTGSNKIGLAFGKVLAPDSDGEADCGRATTGTRLWRVLAMRCGSWQGFLDGEEAPACFSGPGLVRYSAAAGS
jgi:hypothetical protein